MENLKDKIAVVADCGLFVELALTLAKSFKKVYYFTPWNYGGFPDRFPELSGVGFSEITSIDYLFTTNDRNTDYNFDKVDIFIFPELYFSDIEIHLRSLGKKVWGSADGQWLELDRYDSKKIMTKSGMPVNKTVKMKGITKLKDYLKDHDDLYVKISHWRGLVESFKHDTYKLTEPLLTNLENELGAIKESTDFILEQPVDCIVETGIDTYIIDGQIPEKVLSGIELKDQCYAGKIFEYDKLPKSIKLCTDNLAWYFKEKQYRNFYSNEIRVDHKKVPYLIDHTCFAENTEVLTENGWKFFYDLNNDDKVCTLHPLSGDIEYHKPYRYVKYMYDGNMISISNRRKDLNLLVTPDHEVWHYDKNKKNLKSKRADSLTGKIFIPRTGIWKGEEPDFFELPEYVNEWDSGKKNSIHRIKKVKSKNIRTESFIKFMAIYLSDGNVRKKKESTVSISQFDRCEDFELILNELPFEIVRTPGGFAIYDIQLSDYLYQFGKCNDKFIPKFIKNLSPRLINIFLDTYTIADGSRRKDGNNQRLFYTTSKVLADDLQELIFKSGTVGIVSERKVKGTEMTAKGRTYKRKFNSYVISERTNFSDFYIEAWGHKRVGMYLNEVTYKGMVYDVEVENHILYVRTNGRPCWSGNCRGGSPPLPLMLNITTNLAEVIWFGAEGTMIQPKYSHKYGVLLIGNSDFLRENFLPIYFPEEIRENVKLRFGMKSKGTYYLIPQTTQSTEAIDVVATGDSFEECYKKIRKYVEQIKAYGLILNCGILDKVQEELDKSSKIGLIF